MNLLSEEISFAQRFSDDFKKVFSVNGALKSHFVLANRDLFLSRYYALIRGVCHINGRPAPDLQMLPANVSFHFIFFTWIRIELFLHRYEWTQKSFLPFYEQGETDLLFCMDAGMCSRATMVSSPDPIPLMSFSCALVIREPILAIFD
jgi:hypothetical protein